MLEICREELCCGCAACSSVCPRSAIQIVVDKHGFKRPLVMAEKCIECGKCQRACPINADIERRKSENAYAAKAKDKEVRKKSQSGAAFSVIATEILKNGGIVYGAALNRTKVEYQRIENLSQLEVLKKSKYVQADLEGMHLLVENDLRHNKKVLFSGTPCYVASLLSYLTIKRVSTDNLITVDLICYGVPSPGLYDEYLKLEEQRIGKNILDFIFRDKQWSLNEKYSKIAWENCCYETVTNGYLRMFSSKLATRQSCLECKFAQPERVSDITVGDYWGIEKLKPEFDDNRGVSVIICHTPKGQNLFERVKNKFMLLETSFSDAQKKQPALTHPSGQISQYNNFWDDYEKNDLKYVLSKYCDYDTSCHINVQGARILTLEKRFLYSHLRGIVKNNLPNRLRPLVRRILRK